ncbi:MAG: hypothetical protein Q8O22_02930 [Candidatus Omnitrophota bacterium]|nr:hypothetical protein [Candidatus Omnitrophota bacterium]
MKKLLHIIATPRGEESRTLQVTGAFLKAFSEKHADWVVEGEAQARAKEVAALFVGA